MDAAAVTGAGFFGGARFFFHGCGGGMSVPIVAVIGEVRFIDGGGGSLLTIAIAIDGTITEAGGEIPLGGGRGVSSTFRSLISPNALLIASASTFCFISSYKHASRTCTRITIS